MNCPSDTKANDCVSAPPVAPFVQKGRQQVGSLRKMPAAQRHHERRKSLALPIAGKVGHFTTQTLAEDGHIQCEVIPVCHDRGRERQPPVAQTVKARRRQAAKTPLRSAGQAENRGRALGRVKASQIGAPDAAQWFPVRPPARRGFPKRPIGFESRDLLPGWQSGQGVRVSGVGDDARADRCRCDRAGRRRASGRATRDFGPRRGAHFHSAIASGCRDWPSRPRRWKWEHSKAPAADRPHCFFCSSARRRRR